MEADDAGQCFFHFQEKDSSQARDSASLPMSDKWFCPISGEECGGRLELQFY
jgi:hypothetical protein